MKTLFRGFFYVVSAVMVCVTALTSCTDEEKYDFEFSIQGQIVTEFGATVKVPFIARNITSLSVSVVPDGWTVENVDMTNWVITIKAPSAFTADDAGVVENGDLKLTGYTAAGTAKSIKSFLSLLNKQVDLSDKYSNSYVISEYNTRYIIDCTHKGESSERISPANVDILWQTEDRLIDHYRYDADTGKFTFFVSPNDVLDEDGKDVGDEVPDGNAVVAAYDEAGNIIWSWHLWITGSDVESNAITTSVGTFMDRNLGAYHNGSNNKTTDDIYRSYGLYYQWGRKDPFVRSRDYRFTFNYDKSIINGAGKTTYMRYVNADTSDEVGTLEYAIANPNAIVLGLESNDYDWLYNGHDDTLWGGAEKSVYDPCPRGWRVPEGGIYTAFDIDTAEDMASLEDMRNRYGWNLVDLSTGVKLFMPGAGRRSFENGVLTNMNNYGYEHAPMPWVGYYWTAAADGKQAESLFFDLNTTRAVNNRYEPQKPMCRANAMQVRCVRE